MEHNLDKSFDFVVKHYEDKKYDAEEALKKFHASTGTAHRGLYGRRWWATAAAVFAAAFIVIAGGYGFYSLGQKEQASSVTPADEISAPHIFVFDDTPLADALDELSAYYGRKLTAPATDKRLSATFPEDNLDEIVEAIENALEIDITVE